MSELGYLAAAYLAIILIISWYTWSLRTRMTEVDERLAAAEATLAEATVAEATLAEATVAEATLAEATVAEATVAEGGSDESE
jgi:CcmD family protein